MPDDKNVPSIESYERVACGVNQIKELRAIHRQIARYKLAGWKNIEIARQFGLTKERISAIVNSPIFVQHMETLHDKADEESIANTQGLDDEVCRLSQKAVDVLRSFVEDEHGRVPQMTDPKMVKLQTDVARDLLDRAGVRSPATFKDLTDQSSKSEDPLRSIYEELAQGAKAPRPKESPGGESARTPRVVDGRVQFALSESDPRH